MSSAVILGVGELGGVFARAFLRRGVLVQPITRAMRIDDHVQMLHSASVIVLSVGEGDWRAVARTLPAELHERVLLVQNDLHPSDWRELGWSAPAVAAVWFEKKPGKDVRPILPTEIFGKPAAFVAKALEAIAIPARAHDSHEGLLAALALKNAYIVVTNMLGLSLGGGTTGELADKHAERWRQAAREVLAVESRLLETQLDEERILEQLERALRADPDHVLAGRSASSRALRFLERARALGVPAPLLSSPPV